MGNLKTETVNGVKWTAIKTLSNKVVQFLIGIVLARLLSPSDYGVVGMATIFFALAGILIDSGFCTALIRKKETTIEDTSTIFFFNLTVSIVCCIILCIFSNNIAVFLNAPILTDIVKVSALSLVIGSLGSVQWALCTKKVDFKTPALIGLPIQIITGGIAILLAYLGCGSWALVFQTFTATLLSTVAIWFVSDWRPRFLFSKKSFKELFGFSGNLALNAIFDTFYNEGLGMVIGKYYTSSQLGYYSKGQSTAQLPSTVIFSMVSNVIFPVLAKVQDDEQRLIMAYRKFMRIISLFIFFIMMLVITNAKDIVVFLYSSKWIPAILFLQIFGLKYMLWHINAVNWDILMVKGRSDWAFKKEIANKIFSFLCVILAIPYGPIYICYAILIATIENIIVNIGVAGHLFAYGYKKQISDFFPYLFLSVVACIPSVLVSLFCPFMPLLKLMIAIPLSCSIYVGWLWLTKNSDFLELLQVSPLKRFLNGR